MKFMKEREVWAGPRGYIGPEREGRKARLK